MNSLNIPTKNQPLNPVIPWVIACALFMENLDATIITTAIPSMANSFHISPLSLKLAMTSYLISLSVFIPISGWIADKFGPKKVFLYAIFVFTLSSFFCGISRNLWELILFRVIQGFGGAIMMPVGRLILFKIFPKEDLIRVTNYVTIPALFGPMMGPVIGGLLTTYTSWHWVFLVNIPIGVLGVIFANKFIPFISPLAVENFDTKGFIFFGLGLSSFSFLFTTIHENSISDVLKIFIFTAGLLSFSLYILKYFTSGSKLLNFDVFKVRTFKITVIGSLFCRMGIGGIPFLLPLFFQLAFFMSPLASGLLIFPMAAAMCLMKFLVKRIIRIFGFKKCLIFNTLFLGLSISNLSRLLYISNPIVIGSFVFSFASI